MARKIRSYIVFFYLKYFFTLILILLCLIWISQVLRIIDIKYSISGQLIDVITITLLALPSFLSQLIPIILIISYLYFSFRLVSSSEILIINQYLNLKNKSLTIITINIFVFLTYLINNEYLAPKLYGHYKLKEIEFRNNLKLGVPTANEFHIEREMSIFFKRSDGNYYEDIESIIYKDNQFIKSEYAFVEYDKKGFNINFINGYRIKINEEEKSKTVFEKFIFNINKSDLAEVSQDKEHYNTLELITSDNKEFINHAHNKVFFYLFLIVILVNAGKIIFSGKNTKIKKKNLLFSFIVLIYLINSLLLFKLNNDQISPLNFYLFNTLVLLNLIIFMRKFYDN